MLKNKKKMKLKTIRIAVNKDNQTYLKLDVEKLLIVACESPVAVLIVKKRRKKLLLLHKINKIRKMYRKSLNSRIQKKRKSLF
jgi:hypothetical protein